MGTFGALMGSLIAGLAYNLSGRNYAVTFSLSAVPALGALLLVTTVKLNTPNSERLVQGGAGVGGGGPPVLRAQGFVCPEDMGGGGGGS